MLDQAMETAVVQDRSADPWDYSVTNMHARNQAMLEEMLKDRGRQGWELISMHIPMPNEYTCVFKRKMR